MKISVLVTTYNHARFIEQAIASVLAQEASFDWEVLIGDDCSTDGTREIVRRFERENPGHVRLLLPRRNLGFSGNVLFERLIREARGEYIALLDGDDYWTEPTKLRRQVECLEAYPEVTICCHAARNLHPDGRLTPYEDNFEYEVGRDRYRLEDIMFHNFLPTCSLVYRAHAVTTLPRDFRRMPSGDWYLNVLFAQHGDIAYLPGVWGVRRVHRGGAISMKPVTEKILFNIRCMEMVDRHLGRRYTSEARRRIAILHGRLVDLFEEEGCWLRAMWHAWRCQRKQDARAGERLLPSPRSVLWRAVASCRRVSSAR